MRDHSRDKVSVKIEAEPAPGAVPSGDDEVFRIAVLGNFGGAAERVPLSSRRPLLIDRDNFETVLRRVRPQVDTPSGTVLIDSIDNFHPDSLYRRMPAFAPIRETRESLTDPRTSADAVRKLTGRAEEPTGPRPVAGDVLGWVLSGGAAASPQPVRPGDELRAFIDEALRGATVEGAHPQAAELTRKLDQVTANYMRSILHNAAFQSVEAAWRSLRMLVHRLETGPELKTYLVDVAREELASDLPAVYDLLLRRPDRWSLIAADFTFGARDIELMHGLARLAAKADVPVLGEADLSLLEGGQEWVRFRRTPEARWVGLALPRVLVRLPYGADTDPCDAFPFEEVAGKPDRNQMLYGNPALFCALMLSEGTNRADGLPVYTYEDDGETESLPCAEIALNEDTADALLEDGIMPVIAVRHRDSVQMLRFQSVADPPAALAGRWRR